jgi:type I restriction-modification system DNA methylase subunit
MGRKRQTKSGRGSMDASLLGISELWAKWHKEKEYYKGMEVGTGVQIFVKDVLKSPDVFRLKVGLNSTKLEKRKDEFLEEKTTKGSRQADVTIYVTSEIVIPVEVERYTNIDAGKEQLFQYQTDLDKKYGILTDGFSWRFYNNNDFREYTLETILDETGFFLEFWREYTKPEKYYLAFFEKHWRDSLLQETEQLPVEDYRELFFGDITKLIASFKSKLDIEGYLNGLPEKEKAKTAVEITYAYIIQFILYKTLVDNEFDDFPHKYEGLVEAVHRHLNENRFKDVLGIIDGISAEISKNIYRPFSQEQEFIRRKLWDILHRPLSELHDVSAWLDIFVFIKKYNFGEVRNEIFGYIYENYLKALYEDEKKGQYFTDPAVVDFMLEQVGYEPQVIKECVAKGEDSISLVDPACGSGTFLYSAVDRVVRTLCPDSEELAKKVEDLVNKNIFGLDIAEFPLYLAEMNILMRMLPLIINEKYNNPVDKKIKVFKTRDSISEFMDTALRNTMHDVHVVSEKSKGQGFLPFKAELDLGYSSYVRDKDDLREMKESLENWARCPRRRFDFVIGNPPYVSYNECCKQGVLIFTLIKAGKNKLADLSDIYGVNLHSVPENPKRYAPKPNLYAFFIALGLALLKDNGSLCYIIPQTVLINSDLDVIRFHLAKYYTIEKIITFSNNLFISRGLRQEKVVVTSSLIFVVRRSAPAKYHRVEIISYKDTTTQIKDTLQNIRTGHKIGKKNILQRKLLENVANWNFIKHDKGFLDFYDAYKRRSEGISIYYTHAWAKRHFGSKFYFDKGLVFAKSDIHERRISGRDDFQLVELKAHKYLLSRVNRFVDETKIRIPQGSQGIIAYKQKHKIVWSYMNFSHFYFSSDNIVIPYNFVIISSNCKHELVYLMALLNSRVTGLLISRLFRIEKEAKLTILLGIKLIKEHIRVPRMDMAKQELKREVIETTEEILALEEVKLGDLVDFSKVMMQKFDTVLVKGHSLVLRKGEKETRLGIRGDAYTCLVRRVIKERLGSERLEFAQEKVLLSELKALPAIDFEKQAALKDYVDDLVYALYFDIPLARVGFKHAGEVKKLCRKHKFYGLVEKHRKNG